MSRTLYALAGLFIGAAVSVLLNLLSAGIQQRALADQYSQGMLIWIAGLAVFGLLVGYWLGGPVTVPATPASQAAPTTQPGLAVTPSTVTLTRLRALFSYANLRGRGIRLSDILIVGSRIDIDTRD